MPAPVKAEEFINTTVVSAITQLSSSRSSREREFNRGQDCFTSQQCTNKTRSSLKRLELVPRPSALSSSYPRRKPTTIEPHPKYPIPVAVRNLVAMDQLPNPGIIPGQVAPVVAGEKHDEFYRYWDRFLRVKEKTKGKSRKTPSKEIAVKDTKSGRADSIAGPSGRIPGGPPVFSKGRKVGPSLEKDVEGRPGHPQRANTEGVISSQKATTSYDEAVKSCTAKVDAIVRECKRLNQKYYDRLFSLPDEDTLVTLESKEIPHSRRPIVGVGSVKRIEDIYDEPEFFIDGATANDIRQGTNGDCWFLAAITALSGKPELINKLCVARDEQVGVYGFVFFRDGEWISEVVDDRLCLRQSDDSKNYHTEYMITTSGDQNPLTQPLTEMSYGVSKLPQEFRESLRKGSNALYFASCKESNETWLPLLEKAYAKAHGDYQSIEGGFAGEGVEDLTGGIATYIASEDVLDKERLWSELLQVNDKFLFGCGSRTGRDYDPADDEGFVRGHAYTVLAAKEIDKPKNIIDNEERAAIKKGQKYSDKRRNEKLRLLKLRNPWGSQEYNGAWSDGSKEWTPDVMKELNHTFGDDGIFWISYQDFLRFYPEVDRIRLIGDEYTVSQQWTSVHVPFTSEYLDTSFTLQVQKQGPVVLVLSQPDDRYFQGLVGRFNFDLHFRVYKDGEETYLLRSMESAGSTRSCSAELDLEPGSYTILVKVSATRYATDKTAEEVIKQYRETRREKLVAVGKSFDAVHSKGKLREMEENDAKEERLEEKAEDKDEKVLAREQRRKERQRERARRLRREAEAKRKKDEKVKAAKEKRASEKAAKKKENDEKKAKAEAEAKVKAEEAKAAKAKEESAAKDASESTQTEEVKESVEKNVDASVEKLPGEKDGASVATNSTAPGQPTPESNPSDKPEGTQTEEVKESVEKNVDAGVEKLPEEKDSVSVATNSTAPGQLTPESTPSPSSDKAEDSTAKTDGSKDALEQQASAAATETQAAVDKDEAVAPDEVNEAGVSSQKAAEEVKEELTTVPEKKDTVVEKDDEQVPPKEPGHDAAAEDDSQDEQLSCHESSDEEAISECSSVADSDFEWDSLVDGSGEESSDSEGEDDDDMFKGDPWAARCVIGLRVCSLDKNVTIGVKHGSGDGPVDHEEVEEEC